MNQFRVRPRVSREHATQRLQKKGWLRRASRASRLQLLYLTQVMIEFTELKAHIMLVPIPIGEPEVFKVDDLETDAMGPTSMPYSEEIELTEILDRAKTYLLTAKLRRTVGIAHKERMIASAMCQMPIWVMFDESKRGTIDFRLLHGITGVTPPQPYRRNLLERLRRQLTSD